MGFAQAVPTAIDASTAISLATVIVLLGAAWRLSALLARIDLKVERLDTIPERMTSVEGHVQNLETDVSNLWSAFRGDSAGTVRRERGPHAARPRTHPDEERP